MTQPVLDLAASRRRQRRLLEIMQQRRLDAVVVQQPQHVQWLTGCRFEWQLQSTAVLLADGRCLLVAPKGREPESSAADRVVSFEAKWLSTLRNDQRHAATAALQESWGDWPRPKRLGVEFSTFGPEAAAIFDAQLEDVEPQIYVLRRRKESDELALLRKAIAATGEMYQTARAMIEPGVNELDVFNALQATAVRSLGEMLTGTGNDYQANSRGGAPRNNAAQAGQLYILDLGPAYRGYFADTCRTIAVDGRPTDVQQEACRQIAAVFPLIETQVRPGVRCRDIYQQVKELLDGHRPGAFPHHLGHGIGLFPHEAPHLNPNWDDIFEVGDVFTAEPGLYAPDLQAGIRLENNYLVTDNGVELLSDFPLELA